MQGEEREEIPKIFPPPTLNFQPSWKPEDMGTKGGESQGSASPLDQSKAEGWGMVVTVVGGGWPNGESNQHSLVNSCYCLRRFLLFNRSQTFTLFIRQCVSA